MYLMSAPATNAFSPAPVRTTTRAVSSSASSRSRSRSSVSVSTFRALSASWRSIVTTRDAAVVVDEDAHAGTAPRMKSTISPVGAPGPNTPATPSLLQLVRVVVRDRPADDDDDVVRALGGEQLDDARHERHVRAGEDRDADRVRVLLDRRLDDLLGRLVEAGVDDLHAGVAERARDDLRAAIVPVEARLRDDNADVPCHRAEPSSTRHVRNLVPDVSGLAGLGQRLQQTSTKCRVRLPPAPPIDDAGVDERKVARQAEGRPVTAPAPVLRVDAKPSATGFRTTYA